MNLEIQEFLKKLESELEEQMRQPVELQFLNWLDNFLFEVYDEGRKDNNEIEKEYERGYDEGHRDGYDEGYDDAENDYS